MFEKSLSKPCYSLITSGLNFASCHLAHCILPPYILYPARIHTTSYHLAEFFLDKNKFLLDLKSFFPYSCKNNLQLSKNNLIKISVNIVYV
ncbi:MAG: hypothetical protein H6Q16_1033 [Bacteroidetes bacterium]|nr:hypothetical protein [Bacteroidota bacterium]